MQHLQNDVILVALERAKKLMETFEIQGNNNGVINLAREIGMIHSTQLKDYETAIRYFKRSLKVSEMMDNTHVIGQNLSDIGMGYLHLKRFEEALTYTKRSYEILVGLSDMNSTCIALGNLGVIHRHLKNYDQAVRYSTEAIKLDALLGDKYGEAEDNKNLGIVYAALANYELAIQHYQIAGECYNSIGKVYDCFKVLCHQGDVAMDVKAYHEAVRYFQNAYALKDLEKDPVAVASLCLNMGSSLSATKDYARAVGLFKEGISLVEDGYLKVLLLKALGNTCKETGDIEDAILAYTNAAGIMATCVPGSEEKKYGSLVEDFNLILDLKMLVMEYFDRLKKGVVESIFLSLVSAKNRCQENNKLVKIEVLCLLVQIAVLRNDNVHSILLLEETIQLAKQLGDRPTQANCAETMALVKKRTGELEDVARYREMAAEIYQDMGMEENTVDQSVGIANSLKERGLLDEAINEYKKAIKVADETGYQHGRNVALGNMANAYREIGDLQTAVNILEELLETCGECEKASALRFMAFCYEDLSDYAKAIEFHHLSYDISVKQENKEGQLFQISNLGRIYSRRDNLDLALELKLKALDLAVELNYLQEQANQLSGIGVIYMVKNNTDAIEYLETALAINRRIGNQYEIALINSNIGQFYKDRGKFDKAVQYLETALELCREIGNVDMLYSIYWHLGNTYERAEDISSAHQHYTKALEEIEFLRKNLIQEDRRIMFMGLKKTYIYNQVTLFNIDKRSSLSAFEMVEQGKSRTFLDLLGVFSELKPAKLPPDIHAKEIQILLSIKSTYKALANENELQKKRSLIKCIRQENSKLEDLFKDIKNFDPEYAALRLGMPLTFTEVKELL